MRTRYGVLIQSSEEEEFVYLEGLSLLRCDMCVKKQCILLAAVTSRFHTVLQKLHLRTTCTICFDLANVIFA